MPERSRKRPRDPNQLAKAIVDMATGTVSETQPAIESAKLAASLLGRIGGLKGGRARAEKLSASKRSKIARKAAAARWRKHDDRGRGTK
jgi:hypothetical protein